MATLSCEFNILYRGDAFGWLSQPTSMIAVCRAVTTFKNEVEMNISLCVSEMRHLNGAAWMLD